MERIRFLCGGKSINDYNIIHTLREIIEDKLSSTTFSSVRSLCPANYMLEPPDEDEDNEEYFCPIHYEASFLYKEIKYKIVADRMTFNEDIYLQCVIESETSEDICNLDDSTIYFFKSCLIENMERIYKKIFWLEDTQNTKIAQKLYGEIHSLENYLRSIIDLYMVKKYGDNWFETYTFQDQQEKCKLYAEWFEHSKYDLFKKVDYHLYNLQTDDLFELLKEARKINLSKDVRTAVEKLQIHNPQAITTEYLNNPSLWDEENFDLVFKDKMVERWKKDFTKRRNMIAHNKMICKKMYDETLANIEFFKNEFFSAEQTLNNRLKSREQIEQRKYEIDREIELNLELCELDVELPDNQEIVEKINENEDFSFLREMVNEELKRGIDTIGELIISLSDIKLTNDYFFDEETKEFNIEEFQNILEVINYTDNYDIILNMLGTTAIVEEPLFALMAKLIESEIAALLQKLQVIVDNFYVIDFNLLSEKEILKFIDMESNLYSISLNGWFCPDRGTSDTVDVCLYKNNSIVESGDVYASYGDYDITDDGYPIPNTEDTFCVNINDLNMKLHEVIDNMLRSISDLEDKISILDCY